MNLIEKSQNPQQKLLALQAEYERGIPAKLQEVSTLWQAQRVEQWQPEPAEQLLRCLHKLHGSGKTFGFAELSQIAGEIELLLKPIVDGDEAISAKSYEIISEKMLALSDSTAKKQNRTLRQLVQNNDVATSLIYFLESNVDSGTRIQSQLAHFGDQVLLCHDIKQLALLIKKERPAAIIADLAIDLINQNTETDSVVSLAARKNNHLTIEALREVVNDEIPLIVYSDDDSFDDRLNAIQAGVAHYFTKPIDLDQLINTLDIITSNKTEEPFRILIIDDDYSLGTYFSHVLSIAGMQSKYLQDPRLVFDAVDEFHPDLITIDVCMPECSGIDLANIIRQKKECIRIPIVFISSETDIERKFDALRMGGDEFLTKPIDEHHLVQSISIRARRARQLSGFMIQDSLTGLLNHAFLKERLSQEVSHSRRHHTDLCFAMVDIDFFKQVNDQHGHLIGDVVLKSMAQMLKKRLRLSDSIGRYGGEEFAVVLSNCNLKYAFEVLDQIRQDFEKIIFNSGEVEFHVTFSAGIAQFKYNMDAEQLNKVADQMLYRAKETGRNRIYCELTQN